MLFTEMTIGDKPYKLRLDAKSSVLLEKSLGRNPLIVFIGMESGELPTLEDVLKVFHASLRKYHNLSLEEVYDLYDEFIENGGSMVELVGKLSECILNAGYVPRNDEKNAVREK